MAKLKIDFKMSAMLAALLTASVWIVSQIAGLIGQPINELFVSVPATSVITGTVGQRALGFIGGIIPLGQFGGMGILALFISALVAVILGGIMISQFNLPILFKKGILGFNGNTGIVFSTIIYGSIPVYLVLVGTALPSAGAFMGVLVHTFITAFMATWLAGVLKIKI